MIRNEEKKVIKNGVYISILNIFSSVIPMLTIPYITRKLGTDGYGSFSIAFNLVNYFQVLVEYGFAMYGARKIAVAKTQDEINVCFSKIFYSRVVLCVISLMFMSLYVLLFVNDLVVIKCMYILFIMVIGAMFQQNWLLQGVEKMQYITIISVVSRLITLILIFGFVRNPDDIYMYCLLYALTNFFVGLFGYLFVRFRLNVKLTKFNILLVWNELKEAFYVFLSLLGGRIMTSVGITVLGIVETTSNVGIYNAINKIPIILTMMFSPISQAIYPYISKRFAVSFSIGCRTVRKISIPTVILFTGVALFIGGCSEIIVELLFGKEFAFEHNLLKVQMLWMIFSVINNFLGIQTLVASNNNRYYGFAFSATSVFSVIVNIILINCIGLYGAAVAVLISEAFLTVLLIYFICKSKRKQLI